MYEGRFQEGLESDQQTGKPTDRKSDRYIDRKTDGVNRRTDRETVKNMFLFQQLHAIIAASVSIKSSQKLKKILEVRFACSRLGCSRFGCSRLGCSRLGCSRFGCSRLCCSRFGCSRLGCSRLGCSRLGCSILGCSRLGFSKLGCSRLGCSRFLNIMERMFSRQNEIILWFSTFGLLCFLNRQQYQVCVLQIKNAFFVCSRLFWRWEIT